MTPTDDRRRLRDTLRAARRAIAPAQRIAAADALAARLLSLPVSDGGAVAGYWAMDGEIALHVWQLRLPDSLTYCLPVLADDGCLRFAPWRAGQPLVTNRYGIPEPDLTRDALLDARAMALVVTPLVAFDAQGTRLGMGGGWYDRTFAFRSHAPAPPRLVGAAFALQQVSALEREPWDIPLDAVCTETATHITATP